MSLLKKLAGETAIYGLSYIISRVLLFIVMTIYLTRKFSGDTSEYGIYSEMYGYSTIILTILVFRMDTAFFRFGSKGEKHKSFNTGFWAVLILCIISLLVLLPNIDFFAHILQYDESPHYILWFAFILALDAITAMVFAKLRLDSRPIRFMFYKLMNVFVTIFVVLFSLEVLPRFYPEVKLQLDSFLGVQRQIDYVFYANLIASGLIVFLMLPEFRKVTFEFDKPLFKKMLVYSLPLVAVAIAGNINQAVAAPLQKWFLGDSILENLANAGVYAAAAKLAILLNLFTTAFNYAAEPFFFNNSENKNVLEIYGKVALAFTIFVCIVTLGIISYIDIVIMLLGDSYRSAIHIVPILLFAYIFLGLYYNVSIWYKLKDKTIIGAYISILGAVITLAMSLILLPKIGYVASAWAALVCYITMVLVSYIWGRKYFPVKYPVAKILGYIFITALILFGVIYLKSILGFGITYIVIVTLLIGLVLLYAYKKDYPTLVTD